MGRAARSCAATVGARRRRPAGERARVGRRPARARAAPRRRPERAHVGHRRAGARSPARARVDLPGHGHSDWRDDRRYWPVENADDVAVAIARARARRRAWSSGCRSAASPSIALAARAPELVRRLVLVDVTPGVDHEKASPIVAFVAGPERFAELRRDPRAHDRVQPDPLRVVAAARDPAQRHELRRRHVGLALRPLRLPEGTTIEMPDFGALWDDVDAHDAACCSRGGADSWVVDDDDVAEFLRRLPARRGRDGRGRGPQHPGRPAAGAHRPDRGLRLRLSQSGSRSGRRARPPPSGPRTAAPGTRPPPTRGTRRRDRSRPDTELLERPRRQARGLAGGAHDDDVAAGLVGDRQPVRRRRGRTATRARCGRRSARPGSRPRAHAAGGAGCRRAPRPRRRRSRRRPGRGGRGAHGRPASSSSTRPGTMMGTVPEAIGAEDRWIHARKHTSASAARTTCACSSRRRHRSPSRRGSPTTRWRAATRPPAVGSSPPSPPVTSRGTTCAPTTPHCREWCAARWLAAHRRLEAPADPDGAGRDAALAGTHSPSTCSRRRATPRPGRSGCASPGSGSALPGSPHPARCSSGSRAPSSCSTPSTPSGASP